LAVPQPTLSNTGYFTDGRSLFAGVMVAIALSWIARTASEPDDFVRHFSRGAFMRDLNKKIQEIPNAAM
jgi:hypothetical protein